MLGTMGFSEEVKILKVPFVNMAKVAFISTASCAGRDGEVKVFEFLVFCPLIENTKNPTTAKTSIVINKVDFIEIIIAEEKD